MQGKEEKRGQGKEDRKKRKERKKERKVYYQCPSLTSLTIESLWRRPDGRSEKSMEAADEGGVQRKNRKRKTWA